MEREKLRNEMIERAREFYDRRLENTDDLMRPVDLMADFAIEVGTLDGWREIKNEDDLPKKISGKNPILFKHRGNFHFEVRTMPFPYTGPNGMVEYYSHWMPVPPFSPTPDDGGEK